MAADNVERIKDRVDIVDLIGSTVQLRRAGRSFKGLCPFHQEKTPSFVVFPETQGYHCFGCGKSGDIFTFVMETESLTFPDALERLAQRAGIELITSRAPNAERDERRHRLIDLNERAVRFFSSFLWSADAAGVARDLLARRGVDRATAEVFGLGFAPDSWDALKTHLTQSSQTSDDLLVAAGLASKSESGRVYDRFRNRIMFPIRDRRGQAIGFGARALGDEMPKYLNSPQTPVFDKSATLYALDQAFAEIRRSKTLIVVEGYMDAITAHQFGFKNVVASMGTALTAAQVQAIRNYVERVFIALDSDAAGQLATIRAIDTLREGFVSDDAITVDARGMVRTEQTIGAEIRIVTLPSGKDPDDLIRSDPERWEKALSKATPLVEYILTTRLAGIEDSPNARSSALQEIAVPILREIRDKYVRAEYIALAAGLLGYKDTVVQDAVTPRRSRRRAHDQPDFHGARPAASNPEQVLLGLLLCYPLGYALRNGTLDVVVPELFRDARHRELVKALTESGFDVETALSDLPEELSSYADRLRSQLRVRDDLTPGMANNEITQALEALGRSRYQEMVRQTQADIETAKAEDNADQLRESLLRMAELASNKRDFDPRTSPYFNDLRSKAS